MIFRFDPFNNPAQTVKAAEEQLFYFQLTAKSLKAKLERIDPDEENFELTMDEIFAAQRALDQAALVKLQKTYESQMTEYYETLRAAHNPET